MSRIHVLGLTGLGLLAAAIVAACAPPPAAVTCSSKETACDDGTCANLNDDEDNCGACGNACDSDFVCDKGECVPDCDSGEDVCGTGDDAVCNDLSSDEENCGTCGTTCRTGEVCTDGLC